MCCSGKCKYEDYMGDCRVRANEPWPKDALCSDPYNEETYDGSDDFDTLFEVQD